MKRAAFISAFIILLSALLIFFLPNYFLPPVANFLILDEQPEHVDAVVVLSTGMEYFSRLIEAADLYKNGYADIVVINSTVQSFED